jgi:hypothetical protein
MRGMKLMHYLSVDGVLQEDYSNIAFSSNPALVALDILRERARLPFTRVQKFGDDWKSFEAYCDDLIPWDTGSGLTDIKRFESHLAFAQNVEPVTAFRAVFALTPGARWQDVNGAIRVMPSLDRDSTHTFNYDPTQSAVLSNILRRGFSASPGANDELPFNYFIFTYRNLDDPNYKEDFVTVDRSDLRDAYGGILNVFGAFPLNAIMRQSQAERIGWYLSRMLSGWITEAGTVIYPRKFEVKGRADSYHVAKADNVKVSHDLILARIGNPLFCNVSVESFMPKGGERSFTLELSARDLYRDTDHTVKQGDGTTYSISTNAALPNGRVGVAYSVKYTSPVEWPRLHGRSPLVTCRLVLHSTQPLA